MKIVLIAIATLATAAPQASALTLINPDGTPYTGWASAVKSLVPGPTQPIVIDESPCASGAEGCIVGAVIHPGITSNQFAHEVGHLVELGLNDEDRRWFERQLARGSDTGVNFEERFADLYSMCAEQGVMPWQRGNPRVIVRGYGSSYTLIVYRRACRYIRYHTDGLAY